ncbi:MAG: hypothetical protein R3245_01795 [Kiloniellales bacterium]|nr:hypothetical protein [Kiloniellales bacterium]
MSKSLRTKRTGILHGSEKPLGLAGLMAALLWVAMAAFVLLNKEPWRVNEALEMEHPKPKEVAANEADTASDAKMRAKALPVVFPPPPKIAPAVGAPRKNRSVPVQSKGSVAATPPSVAEYKIIPLPSGERTPAPEAAFSEAVIRPITPLAPEEVEKRQAEISNAEPADPSTEPMRKREKETSTAASESLEVGEAEAREGRALLRLLEHGSGPQIELAWPGSPANRASLFRVLRSCYGMRLALLDESGRLYRVEGDVGSAWTPNLDRFSGFMRKPSGRSPEEEKILFQRAQEKVPGAIPVRLFPRRVDALLLGGLATFLGEDYRSSKAIRATYRLSGSMVEISEIAADGKWHPGRIDLRPAAEQSCRGARA